MQDYAPEGSMDREYEQAIKEAVKQALCEYRERVLYNVTDYTSEPSTREIKTSDDASGFGYFDTHCGEAETLEDEFAVRILDAIYEEIGE